MPLADQHASVVHGLGEAELEDQGLQAALKEVLGAHSQHVIQLALGLVQKPILVHAPQQGLALKQPLGLLLIQSQQIPGSLCMAGNQLMSTMLPETADSAAQA